jgi:hypothetical protein
LNEEVERILSWHDAARPGDGQELSGEQLAQKTIDNFVEKALRLYEQEPPHLRMKRLGEYSHRWAGWALSVASAAVTPC